MLWLALPWPTSAHAWRRLSRNKTATDFPAEMIDDLDAAALRSIHRTFEDRINGVE